jgi:hypothetical protein
MNVIFWRYVCCTLLSGPPINCLGTRSNQTPLQERQKRIHHHLISCKYCKIHFHWGCFLFESCNFLKVPHIIIILTETAIKAKNRETFSKIVTSKTQDSSPFCWQRQPFDSYCTSKFSFKKHFGFFFFFSKRGGKPQPLHRGDAYGLY